MTRRAFATREQFLAKLGKSKSEDQLARMFESRMGRGLVRVLASKVKGGDQ